MAVNGEAILGSMTREFEEICQCQESPHSEARSYTIQRVPLEVRSELNSTYLVPKVVSIGPVHRGNEKLLRGQLKKWKNLHNRLDHDKELLKDIIHQVSNSMVTEARNCYEKQLVDELDNTALVKIMLLDGCYIIDSILEVLNGGYIDADMQQARNDLLLLENQIPFPVLQCLFDSVYQIMINNPEFLVQSDSLNVMAQKYVAWPRAVVSCGRIPDPVHHLLHLFHSSLRPLPPVATRSPGITSVLQNAPPDSVGNSCWSCRVLVPLAAQRHVPHQESVPGVPWRALQSATKLLEAGVKFRLSKEAGRSMIDVRFRGGYVEFPSLYAQNTQFPALSVQSSTVSQFLNLLAFEKCKPEYGNHVTVYLAFMNSLIDNAKDVNLLVSFGVLENKLGRDEDVANFFNTAVYDKRVFWKLKEGHYLTPLFKDLEAYCAVPRHRYRAKLECDYLSSPWSVISLIAGTVLLFLSLTQTTFAVLAYFNRN